MVRLVLLGYLFLLSLDCFFVWFAELWVMFGLLSSTVDEKTFGWMAVIEFRTEILSRCYPPVSFAPRLSPFRYLVISFCTHLDASMLSKVFPFWFRFQSEVTQSLGVIIIEVTVTNHTPYYKLTKLVFNCIEALTSLSCRFPNPNLYISKEGAWQAKQCLFYLQHYLHTKMNLLDFPLASFLLYVYKWINL